MDDGGNGAADEHDFEQVEAFDGAFVVEPAHRRFQPGGDDFFRRVAGLDQALRLGQGGGMVAGQQHVDQRAQFINCRECRIHETREPK